MEVKWIEDFIALAQYQSFSRAAEVRNVTQSGLSRRIQSLEQWIGAALVDRSTYPPTLTAAGRLFREAAEEVVGKLMDTRAIIRSEQRMPGVGLQIAAGHALSVGFVPDWLQTLSRSFGALRVRILPTNVHDSVLMLVNGGCELMLAYEHPELSLHLDAARYPHIAVGQDLFVPVCAPDKRGRARYRLPGAPDRPMPLIAYGGTSYFGRCLGLLLQNARIRPALTPHFESDMADVARKLAVNGEGLAWLPRSLIDKELAAGTLVMAGERNWQLELELRLYRDRHNQMPLLNDFWHFLEAGGSAAATI